MSEESTTPDLVEMVRQLTVAMARRDLDAQTSFFAADAAWDASQVGIGAFEGAAVISSFVKDWLAAYEEWEVEWEELQDLGNGVVFGVHRQDARLVGSMSTVQERYAMTFGFGSTGLIVSVLVAQDIDEARAAAERLAEERG
jgi:limonene-1,2-epoxide hydrolase